jgi:hypothetical protein
MEVKLYAFLISASEGGDGQLQVTFTLNHFTSKESNPFTHWKGGMY